MTCFKIEQCPMSAYWEYPPGWTSHFGLFEPELRQNLWQRVHAKRILRPMAKQKDPLSTKKMIATFMKGSSPLEAYLHQGGELTDSDLNSVELTVAGLVTFLDTWKRKHTMLKLSSGIPLVVPSFQKPRAPKRGKARK